MVLLALDIKEMSPRNIRRCTSECPADVNYHQIYHFGVELRDTVSWRSTA